MRKLLKQENLTVALASIFLLFTLSPAANSQSLKQLLLMPDKLTENHQKYEPECEKCHSDFDQSEQTGLCLDCHETIAADLESIKGFHGINKDIASKECKECHTDHKGREFDIVGLDTDTFNHNKTNFSLEGKHRSINCINCHKQAVTGIKEVDTTQPAAKTQTKTQTKTYSYRLEEFQCQNCHGDQSPHNEQIKDSCDSCHGSDQWQEINYDHDATDFQLNGSHQTTACQDCHIKEQYKDIGKECNSCHAIDDSHRQRFGQKCADCHNEEKWTDSFFDHDRDTEYKLLFSHRETTCKACHTEPAATQKLVTECIGCHRPDDIHNGNHGEQCADCHTEKSWSTSQFDHDKNTDFPLTGKHREASCSTCHNQQQDNKTAGVECVDCHRLADPHQQSQGDDCQQCHNSNSWTKTLFSHELVKFPLIGMHRQLSCEDCHITTNYSDTDNDCSSCHKSDDYHDGSLGNKCEQCHTPNDWSMWIFEHSQQGNFELMGAHKDLQCVICHEKNKTVRRQCISCHRDDDIHRGSFGQQCQHCHDETSFTR